MAIIRKSGALEIGLIGLLAVWVPIDKHRKRLFLSHQLQLETGEIWFDKSLAD